MRIASTVDSRFGAVKIKDIDIARLVKGYREVLGIDVQKLFKGITSLGYFRCSYSGFRFFFPAVEGDSPFYRAMEKYDWYYNENKWEFSFVNSRIGEGPVLEFGCGNGHFLKKILEKGIPCVGTEINENAQQVCLQKGLHVLSEEQFRQKKDKFEKFRYIVSFQLLEHLGDVAGYFKTCHALLADDGYLITAVPNNDSYVFNTTKDYMYTDITLLLNLPPHHTGHWTKMSFIKAASLYGFLPVETACEPLYASRQELVRRNMLNRHAALLENSPLANKILSSLISKNYRSMRGDTMIIVLKKK